MLCAMFRLLPMTSVSADGGEALGESEETLPGGRVSLLAWGSPYQGNAQTLDLDSSS